MPCDIEAAFLEAGMNIEMYIEPHPAMVVCGFMVTDKNGMNMQQSQADPFVFYKFDEWSDRRWAL